MKVKTAAALVMSILLSASAVSAQEVQTEAPEEKEVLTLGEKTGESDYEVTVSNDTGMEIKEVSVRVDNAEFGGNLLEDGDIFAAGEVRTLFCTPKELEPGAVSAPRYDIRLVFADENTAVIHTFPFGDADEVQFCFSEEEEAEAETETAEEETEEEQENKDGQTVIAYLKFVSKSLGYEQNTYQHEKDTLYPPAVDYTYDSGADYSYDWSADYSYDGGADYSYSEPVYEAPVYADNGQADDQCLDDGVFN